MNLYLIKRETVHNYDDISGLVVAADTEEQARSLAAIHATPGGGYARKNDVAAFDFGRKPIHATKNEVPSQIRDSYEVRRVWGDEGDTLPFGSTCTLLATNALHPPKPGVVLEDGSDG